MSSLKRCDEVKEAIMGKAQLSEDFLGHLEECPDCRQFQSNLFLLKGRKTILKAPINTALVDRIMAQIATEGPPGESSDGTGPDPKFSTTSGLFSAKVFLFLVIAALAYYVFHSSITEKNGRNGMNSGKPAVSSMAGKNEAGSQPVVLAPEHPGKANASSPGLGPPALISVEKASPASSGRTVIYSPESDIFQEP